MKSNRILFVLALFSICIAPAYGASKEIIELQTQVEQLQHQMTQMKQSFDERMGVMKNLLEQNTAVTNKATTCSLRSSPWQPSNHKRSSRPRRSRRRPRPTCSTTMPCAITTARKMT